MDKHTFDKQRVFDITPNYLACLVIAGVKTTTCSGRLLYDIRREALPQVNEVVQILDSQHRPFATIKLHTVEQFAFGQVPKTYAQMEGEEYEAWFEHHQVFFNQQLAELRCLEVDQYTGVCDKNVTADFQVICEQFCVVHIEPKSYAEWLSFAEKVLLERTFNDPYLNIKRDIQVLLSFVTGRNKAAILAFPETLLCTEQLQHLAQLLVRRANGEPIAYIIGEKEFWSLPLKVSPDTLIPRPDTEILVEKALEIALFRLNAPDFSGELTILDLGTGTGAIALALAAELMPCAKKRGVNVKILGVDVVPGAVELAKQNAQQHQLEVEFVQSHWFSALTSTMRFDVIVSNPPYIDADDVHLSQGDVRFEPRSALVSEQQGYADLQEIIQQAHHFLKDGGYLLVEHGWRQGEKVRSIFQENQWQAISTIQDYSSNERVTLGVWGLTE